MRLLHPLATAAVLACCLASAPALAHEVVYIAQLSGPAESPPNASPGTGFATITFNDHDFSMRLEVSFSGLVGNVTAAHIHCCTANPGASTAGVATQLPSFSGFPLGGTSGSYDNTFNMTLAGSWNPAFVTAHGGTTGQAFSDLLAGAEAGKAYLNIHTSAFGGGEIRGFLALAPVPEPGSWALMLAGLGLVATRSLRRRQ
jgi:hypothetical protein